MLRAVLIDLDDTLLANDLGRFLPAYFDLLATELSVFGPKEAILNAVLAGTRVMLDNEDPTRSLARAFYDGFGAATEATADQIAPVIERFYQSSYPRLAGLTSSRAAAPDLLRSAAELGLSLAVATNPLMTLSAIRQRLAWAGVPSGEFDYALITDVESFHFAKPRPAYFAEVLARLGLLPSEAAMIGNDPEDDLAPAATLGIRGFHVATQPDPRFAGGGLDEARAWLERQAAASSAPVLEPEALIARLEGQLAALLSKLDGKATAPATHARGSHSLTPLQVVCHLRDVEREVNLPRLQQFLARDDPFFSAVDTDAWIEGRAYEKESLEAARAEMVQVRLQVVELLRGLEPGQWRRTARHALLGPTTLAEWVAVLAEHDLRHQAELHGPRPSRIEGVAS